MTHSTPPPASERQSNPRPWQIIDKGSGLWRVINDLRMIVADFYGPDAESHARLFCAAEALAEYARLAVEFFAADSDEKTEAFEQKHVKPPRMTDWDFMEAQALSALSALAPQHDNREIRR